MADRWFKNVAVYTNKNTFLNNGVPKKFRKVILLSFMNAVYPYPLLLSNQLLHNYAKFFPLAHFLGHANEKCLQ